MPALVCHGRADPVVPSKMGKELSERLSALGLTADFREYALMAHDFSPAELKDTIAFINR
jgi:predicted esterase